MKRLARIALLLLTPACFQAATRFATHPVGAQIYMNGELIGTTPCIFFYDRVPSRRYRIQIRKAGYVDYEFFLDPKLFTTALEEQYRFTLEPVRSTTP